jgi:hypothetical protein
MTGQGFEGWVSNEVTRRSGSMHDLPRDSYPGVLRDGFAHVVASGGISRSSMPGPADRSLFRNQYIIVSHPVTSPLSGLGAVDFGDLRIHAHPALNVSLATRSSTSMALLGYIVDPFHPERTNHDIVNSLAETCGTPETLFREIASLSGRYVLLYRNPASFIVTGDACHLRQIYFGFPEGNLVLTSSPKLFLTFFHSDLRISREKEEFIHLPAYATQEGAWYGDRSIDDRLGKLLPNHYLDLIHREVRRIPFSSGHEPAGEDHVAQYASALLKGTYAALSQRYRLLQPITAGWDSRILLSACREFRKDMQFYVFPWSSPETADVWVARNLSRRLGVHFSVIEPGVLREEFLSKYRQEHILPRILPKTAQIQYHYDNHYDPAVINVNGNGAEIARCFYGYTSRKVSLDMLLLFSGYGRKAHFVEEELEKWHPQGCRCAADSGIPLLDLFYWEQRMGNWGALFPFEQDIAVEEISPFNNRSLLCALLRVPPPRRKAPHYLFFQNLALHLWPEALSEKVNPDAHYVKELVKGSSRVRYFVMASCRAVGAVRSRLAVRPVRGPGAPQGVWRDRRERRLA